MQDGTPIYLTPMVRQWQCRKRGLCCRGQDVPIDEVERRRLERRLRELSDPRAERFASDSIKRGGSGWAILPRVDHQCVFLGVDDLCGVRTTLGDGYYPWVCKKFPYLSILTDDRQVIDLTFKCPTALQLLAEETSFTPELVHEEPPVDHVVWLAAPDSEAVDLRGEAIPIERFWSDHWALLARFRARPEADPLQRLVAFAEDVTGLAAPAPLMLSPELLAHGAFATEIDQQLRARGGVPAALPLLWQAHDEGDYTLDPLPPLDEDALVLRYLGHRLACPTYYLSSLDHRHGLTVLFAMLARYRILRARGLEPLPSIRELDCTFIHGGAASALYCAKAAKRLPSQWSSTESTFVPWRAMASLACTVHPAC